MRPPIHRHHRRRMAVRNGLVLLPGSMARGASIGGSGDAAIVRVVNASGATVWVGRKANEVAMPGLYRIDHADGVDYGFGALGVEYQAVDGNGTPLVGGGLLVAPPETENILNNCFSELGAGGGDVFAAWSESASGTSTIAQETSDLPAGFSTACRIDMDATGSAASVAQTLNLTVAAGDVLWLSTLGKAASGSGLKFRIVIDNGAGGSVQYLDAAGTAWTVTASDFAPANLPTAWDDWHWKLPAIPAGITRLVSLEIKGAGTSVSQRFTNVMLTKTPPHHIRIRTTTAAVSRGADTMTAFDFFRRTTLILELDEALADGEGVVLAKGTQPLVEILAARTVRITSPNGATVTTTGALPSSQRNKIGILLEPNRVRVSLNGGAIESLSGNFDWQNATGLSLGSKSDGTGHVGVPIRALDRRPHLIAESSLRSLAQ